MNTIIRWLIEANIAFIALYLFYVLFLKRDTFFREKRFAFLTGLLFALLYPFIDLPIYIQDSKPAADIVRAFGATLPDVIVTTSQKANLTNEEIVIGLYLLAVAFFFIRMQLQLGSVLILAARGQKEKLDTKTIIHLPTGSAPFSFFKWIFINPDECCSQDIDEILHHEQAHVSQLHTFDVLFSELLCVLFWINPFIWLLRNAIRENLEYLADRKVIHSGFNQKSYQYHLLRLSAQQTTSTMGNYFNVSQLKKRIIMMNKKKSSLAGLSKYALGLPIFALLLLSSNTYSATPINKTASKEATTKATTVTKDTIEIENVATKPITQTKQSSKTTTTSPKVSEDKPLTACEQMPVFPGGEKALIKFISDNLHYPLSASEAGVEGRVTVRFAVKTTGEVTDVVVIRGLDFACDDEAIRVVKLLPKWIPGKQDGRNVSVYFTLPINFVLKNRTAA
jgi:TonB family protein